MYDNITAGVFDCEATLDQDVGDDYYYHEDDSGWYAMQWHVEDQWLSYDFGVVQEIGHTRRRRNVA